MEQQIIDWLVALVEAEDRVNEWIENEKHSLRSQGKTLVDERWEGDDVTYYDYLTGEPIPEEQLSDDKYWNVEGIEEYAWDVHGCPGVPAELKGILNEDLAPEDARAWLNKNVLPL